MVEVLRAGIESGAGIFFWFFWFFLDEGCSHLCVFCVYLFSYFSPQRNAMGETLDNRRRTGISDSKAAIDFVKRMNYWDRKVHDQEAHDEL